MEITLPQIPLDTGVSYAHSQLKKADGFINSQYQKLGKHLDKNPALYEKVLIINHIFRSTAMFAAMKMLPFSPTLSFGAMLAPSLLYRASIERFCVFRFTLPALAGGAALWAAQAATLSIVAGTAFSSLGAFFAAGLGIASLAGYLVFVCKTSHEDIAKYMQGQKKPCCKA